MSQWLLVSLFDALAYRWAESELLDTLMRLEVGLAGRVEAWKATKWAAKLEQIKGRNDNLVGTCWCILCVSLRVLHVVKHCIVLYVGLSCLRPCCVAQATALESAVRRFSKLEDAAHEAQLATDVHAVSREELLAVFSSQEQRS